LLDLGYQQNFAYFDPPQRIHPRQLLLLCSL